VPLSSTTSPGRARALAEPAGIAADRRQRLPHADPLGVPCLEHARVERAGDGAGTDQRGGEAHALLVAERDDFDRVRQKLAGFVQRRHRRDGGEHAQGAVVGATVAHRVDVRAEQQRRVVRFAPWVAADDVADRVDGGAHARLLHPGPDPVGRRDVRRGEIEASQPPGLVAAGGQLVQAGQQRRARFRRHGNKLA
jgi:hypothetical protein